jgi:hypothetical protein
MAINICKKVLAKFIPSCQWDLKGSHGASMFNHCSTIRDFTLGKNENCCVRSYMSGVEVVWKLFC